MNRPLDIELLMLRELPIPGSEIELLNQKISRLEREKELLRLDNERLREKIIAMRKYRAI